MMEHLYPVILAGGSGTRFWPLSRHRYPKQLLRIIGDETLIQQTMRRVLSCAKPEQVLISTNPGQADSIRVQLGEWKSELKDNYVIEPVGRNTAPAIALVAAELLRRDPEAMMLVLPADHVVTGAKAFQAAVALGAQLAERGHLVTFGIKPTRPETGYGYIQPNRRTSLAKKGRLTGHPVARFVEKPNRTKAAQYLKNGNYFWNSGMFLWKAADHSGGNPPAPAAAGQGHPARPCPHGSGAEPGLIEAAYKKVPSVSIDNGVMEQSAQCGDDSGRVRMVGCGQLEQPRGGRSARQGRKCRQRAGHRYGQQQFRPVRRSPGCRDHRAHGYGGRRYAGCHVGLSEVPLTRREDRWSRF